MAFEIKYRIEFQDITESVSAEGVIWRIDLLENNFAGNITDLTPTDTPLIFNYDNDSDNVFDPIRPSSAEFNVYSDTNFALQDIYSIEQLQFQVNIYVDSVLYWWGYIEPQQYKEVYEPVSYPVTLTAVDGLSLLDCEYKNGNEYYTGRRYESQVILDCLGKIGHTEFIEYVNLYEDTTDSSVDDSSFDQILIDTLVFRGMSFIDVLKEVLQKYNAIIRQKDGVFNIFRPVELKASTVYGRHFTAYNTKTSVTRTTTQYINRLGYVSNRWQVPGGILMVQPPVQKVIIDHDYGSRESWIENYNFAVQSLTYDFVNGFTFANWVNHGTVSPQPPSIIGLDDTEGCIIPYSAAPATNYISQSFAPDAVLSVDDMFVIDLDWMVDNKTDSPQNNVELRIIIKADGGNYYLKEKSPYTGECEWGTNPANGFLSIPEGYYDAVPGDSGWQNWKRMFIGIPFTSSYTVSVFPLYNSKAGIWLGVRNIKFYTSSTSMNEKKLSHPHPSLKGLNNTKYKYLNPWLILKKEFDPIVNHQYVAENSINGYIIANKYSFLLGDVVDQNIDNIPSQFAGALTCNSGSPQVKVDIITLLGSSGTANITCNGYSQEIVYVHPLAVCASDYEAAYASDFLSYANIILTSSGNDLIFTGNTSGEDFDTTIINTSGTLTGTIETGSAFTISLSNTKTWSTRDGNEQLTLLQLIADEVKVMYSRPKQLIQMPVMEAVKTLQIDTLGNFQDTVNKYFGAVRIFCMNRGVFNVRDREWDIDLFEIGTGAVIGGTGSTTVDSTTVTVDSTTVTVDSDI